MKVVIIEDEKPAARKLERLISNFTDLQLVATLHSVEDAVDWFSKNEHPKLIFSDIVLGDGLSFDIFEKVPTKSFIIYTTAFDQYTLKAFKLNSIDYLLKPISEEDLAKAIEKFKSFLPSEETHNALEMKSLIKENGILITMMFPLTEHEGGPPFSVSFKAYSDLLSDSFDCIHGPFVSAETIPTRIGREQVAIWKKRN